MIIQQKPELNQIWAECFSVYILFRRITKNIGLLKFKQIKQIMNSLQAISLFTTQSFKNCNWLIAIGRWLFHWLFGKFKFKAQNHDHTLYLCLPKIWNHNHMLYLCLPKNMQKHNQHFKLLFSKIIFYFCHIKPNIYI